MLYGGVSESIIIFMKRCLQHILNYLGLLLDSNIMHEGIFIFV